MPGEEPSVAAAPPRRIRLRRVMLYSLYVLLILAAAVTLWGAPGIEEGEGWRSPVLLLAAGLLTLFVIGFSVYRFALVRAGRYHAGKAFVQVGFMVLVLVLVLPGRIERWRGGAAVPPVDLTRQLASADAEARAMAAELARHRPPEDARRYVPRLVELLSDASPEVRRQARGSLVVLAGQDAGGSGEDAPDRWRAFWSQRGVGTGPAAR